MRVHALDAIRSWPAESRQAANWILHVHHEPDEVSESEIVWDGVEPWHRIVAMREFETRPWPIPHTASIRSVIRYVVPPDREEALGDLDLCLDVDRESGLVSTVGRDLRTNLLTFNLMHDVVTGALEPAQARSKYTAALTAPPDGTPPDDMARCRFDDLKTTEPSGVRPSESSAGRQSNSSKSTSR